MRPHVISGKASDSSGEACCDLMRPGHANLYPSHARLSGMVIEEKSNGNQPAVRGSPALLNVHAAVVLGRGNTFPMKQS